MVKGSERHAIRERTASWDQRASSVSGGERNWRRRRTKRRKERGQYTCRTAVKVDEEEDEEEVRRKEEEECTSPSS
jgi:hypothetical protein